MRPKTDPQRRRRWSDTERMLTAPGMDASKNSLNGGVLINNASEFIFNPPMMATIFEFQNEGSPHIFLLDLKEFPDLLYLVLGMRFALP